MIYQKGFLNNLKNFKIAILLFTLLYSNILNASFMDALQLFQNVLRVLGDSDVEYKNVIETQNNKDQRYIRTFINSTKCDNETKYDTFTTCDKKGTTEIQYIYFEFITDTLSTKEVKYKEFKEIIYPVTGSTYNFIDKEVKENLFMFGKGHVLLQLEEDYINFITWGRYIENSRKCYSFPKNNTVKS